MTFIVTLGCAIFTFQIVIFKIITVANYLLFEIPSIVLYLLKRNKYRSICYKNNKNPI